VGYIHRDFAMVGSSPFAPCPLLNGVWIIFKITLFFDLSARYGESDEL
jgi:hypothetical protein